MIVAVLHMNIIKTLPILYTGKSLAGRAGSQVFESTIINFITSHALNILTNTQPHLQAS